MNNYRELFERLAKCNLPAGIKIIAHDSETYGYAAMYTEDAAVYSHPNYDKPDQCRAALMLIVDAMRAEGWWFEFHDERDRVFYVEAEHDRTNRVFTYRAQDEVTPIAECLIAALGVAE